MLQIQLDLSYEVKPTQFVEPLALNPARYVMEVRLGYEWDFLTRGACLDATDHLPLGGHDAHEFKESHIASATANRSQWVG